MVSRLRVVHVATRPKMYGRCMISGPSGSGKTWTGLSIATYLVAFEHFLAAGGDPGNVQPGDIDISTVEPHEILVIDTEKESALTYADVFKFSHLAWKPPFDPTELQDTLAELDQEPPVVTFVDSFSKFWHGQGGTLDVAGGAIGGWKHARPIQEALVEQILSTNTHIILGVRSKMEYLIEGGKGGPQTVTKMGLNPMQDDNLVYEMNVAIDIDMEHRVTVTKSRTPAVPVGRMYPAGLERKMAEDYADWLAGGVPPASREDVDAIVERFAQISGKNDKIVVKTDFMERFGMPHSLTADRVAPANQWLDERIAQLDGTATADSSEESGDGRDDPQGGSPTTVDDTPPGDSDGDQSDTPNSDETTPESDESAETAPEAPEEPATTETAAQPVLEVEPVADGEGPGTVTMTVRDDRKPRRSTRKTSPTIVDTAADTSDSPTTDEKRDFSTGSEGGSVDDGPPHPVESEQATLSV